MRGRRPSSKPSSFSLYSSSPLSQSLLVFLIDLGSASARLHLLRPPQTKNTKNWHTCYTVRLTCQKSDEKGEFCLTKYSGSSPNGHSRKRTVLLTATFTKLHFFDSKKPVFFNSRKRPALELWTGQICCIPRVSQLTWFNVWCRLDRCFLSRLAAPLKVAKMTFLEWNGVCFITAAANTSSTAQWLPTTAF